MISHTWNFKEGYKRTYLQNRNRVMDAENKLWLSGDKERGINWETGTGIYILLCIQQITRGFLGGSVVKNPLANAGDMGSIPDPGRSHMLRNS